MYTALIGTTPHLRISCFVGCEDLSLSKLNVVSGPVVKPFSSGVDCIKKARSMFYFVGVLCGVFFGKCTCGIECVSVKALDKCFDTSH
jgi:hypothetical protein